jgi:ANTAR domain/GAF domain
VNSTSQSQLVATMLRLARSMGSPRDYAETLDAIVRAAVDTIPGVDHASITVINDDLELETLIPSDQFVVAGDELQCALGEGPCLDAAAGTPMVRSDNLSEESRWPSYAPKAAAMGVGSQLAVHLYEHKQTYGGLNLYFDRADAISAATVDLTELFAHHSAMALGHAKEREGLISALDTRKTIGQATGIVMERYGISEARAFEYLIRVSQTGNVKLRVVADEVVKSVDASAAG